MNVSPIEKPALPDAYTKRASVRLRLRGISAASTERPSRLDYPIATICPYEEETADFGPSPGPETQKEGTRVKLLVETVRPERQPTLAERLLKLAGTVPGLPSDLAEQHDHYLHGTPRR
jgi:hypothetical protein